MAAKRDVADFDAFVAEAEQAGPVVRVAGQEWTLPADVPASTIARIQRLRVELGRLLESGGVDDDDDVPEHLMEGVAELESPVAILRSLIGDELVDGMLDAGMGSAASRMLAATALQFYETGVWDPSVGNGQAPKGAPKQPQDHKPKAKAKAKGSGGKTSSRTGARSKPTSNANTASTS